MLGQLTYREERPKGLDPVNDPIDLVFSELGEVVSWLGTELLFELLFGFLELL